MSRCAVTRARPVGVSPIGLQWSQQQERVRGNLVSWGSYVGMVIGRGGNRRGSLMRVTRVGVRALSGLGIVHVYCIN